MKKMLISGILVLALGSCNGGTGQSGKPQAQVQVQVGGRCEGCEAIHESPLPFDQLNHIDTLPDFNDPGPRLVITGTVFLKDGKTPAKDVVVYVYHTDQEGHYPSRGDEKGWARQHGYLRGWVKTNEKGEYRFYTLRPASYPNSNNPQHIHITIKEPDKNAYWIDDIHFLDDPLVTSEMKRRERKVGGSGLVKVEKEGGLWRGKRDIILGMNVAAYP